MAGSATLTTVPSTVTTAVPRMQATSISRLVLEEGVAVLPALVGELRDRHHALVVVGLDLVERAVDAARGARAERVRDVALLARGLDAVVVEDLGGARERGDLRVDVRHGRRQALLVELAQHDVALVLAQQRLRDRA